MKLKEKFIKMCGLLLITGLLAAGSAGCAQDKGKANGEHLTVAGSTSVQPISDLLAEKFMDKYPHIRVSIQGGGSSAGIQAAESGAADLGASSRELKPEEKHLHETVICRDGIALVVNPDNPVDDLSFEEIRDIFAGKITSWEQLGGRASDIVVVSREAGSGTRGAFEEIVLGKEELVANALIQNSTGAVRTTVAGNKDAVGYVSLAGLSEEVKTLEIGGVEPTADNIVQEDYPINRPFLYVSVEAPSGAAKQFIDFILSPEGQEIIDSEGLVKVN